VQAACRYEKAAKDALWQLKFGNARAAAVDIAQVMQPLLEQFRGQNVVVVHIPTATSRVRMRGYDQAKLIARICARYTKLRHAPLLMRMGQQRQVGLRREQRLSQLENAYQVRNEASVRGAHIVLVDDVVTTGATLEAAAKTLKQAGARKIEAVVFAQA
jgi:ComF family protein